MVTAKEFLTGELTEEEKKQMKERVGEISEEFLDSLPKLKAELDQLADGEKVELESRTVTVTMPAKFWEMTDKFAELFDLSNTLSPDSYGTNFQHNIREAFKQVHNDITTKELLVSQAVIDALLLNITDIARAELMIQLQHAVEKNDVEALMRVMQRIKEENLGEPPDLPDDSGEN